MGKVSPFIRATTNESFLEQRITARIKRALRNKVKTYREATEREKEQYRARRAIEDRRIAGELGLSTEDLS